MEGEITLVTTSGKWRKVVSRSDPVFSSLIPDLDELPEELVLTGSVAEILEEDWEYYEMLETTHQAYLTDDVKDPEYEHERSSFSIVESASVMTLVERGLPIVHQSWLSRLSGLIEIPLEYKRYIFVDETVPLVERRSHIKSLTKLQWSYYNRRMYDATRKLMSGVFSSLDEHPEALELAVAHLHNAELIAASLGRPPSIYDVDWEEVSEIMRGKSDEEMQEMIDNLLGRGKFARYTYSIYFTSKLRPSGDLTTRVTGEDLLRMHHAVMSTIDEGVEPYSFGLEAILSGRFQYGYGHSFVREVHEYLLAVPATLSTSRKEVRSLEEEYFPLISRIMYYTIGKTGMVRVLLSLLHGLESEENVDRIERSDAFSRILEADLEKIERGEELEPLDQEALDAIDPRLLRPL